MNLYSITLGYGLTKYVVCDDYDKLMEWAREAWGAGVPNVTDLDLIAESVVVYNCEGVYINKWGQDIEVIKRSDLPDNAIKWLVKKGYIEG